MSTLPANPHYKTAQRRLDGVHEWQAEDGATDETMQAVALDALTEATLALAFEQRTANLIAYSKHIDDTRRDVMVQIGFRLGLTSES